MRHRNAALIFCALLLLPAPPGRAVDNSDCFTCHTDESLSKTDAAGTSISLFINETNFTASIHGQLQCTACHGDITEAPHPDGFAAKPVSCSQCHRIESEIYLKSDHGIAVAGGVTEAASCQACHGRPHELLNYRNAASPVHRANVPATCAQCHGNAQEMEKFNLRQRAVVVTYDKSVHGVAHGNGVATAAVCTDCHGSHDLHRSMNPESKLNWQRIPGTCGKCHENVQQTFARSIHGQAATAGVRDAPVCTDCHGEHTIQAVATAASSVSSAHIPETCGQCHGAERIASRFKLSPTVVETYLQSFHGLALQFGGVAAANCASCHGFHDILPSSDPLSSVNKANLPQTCGKCHPGIGTRLALGEVRIHAPPGAAEGKPWIVNFVSWFYIAIIVLTIGGMAAFNLLDYMAKARLHVRAVQASPHAEERLPTLARLQHATLIAMFVLLAYTGFVHKFPDAWWSWPFRAMENGGYIRGMIHRVCGWTFAALFAMHLGALFATKRGRHYLRELWLRRHDLSDFFITLAGNLRLRPAHVPPRRFNFAEKTEYWALIWGSFVMILTGAMLIFTETVLRLWPKVWHDVAQVVHYYEAVLATLAIVVWHFYWVIFDPKEYPMNPAWLIGKKAPHAPAPPASPPTEKTDAAS
jgi:cytochrome b subunit of formate dehydrogenase/DnaJ-class molecular chaperone